MCRKPSGESKVRKRSVRVWVLFVVPRSRTRGIDPEPKSRGEGPSKTQADRISDTKFMRVLKLALLCLIVQVFAWQLSSNLARRDIVAATSALLVSNAALATEPAPMVEIDPSRFSKIPGGGQRADLKVGTGTEIGEGSKVSLQWVLRRSNGYYVDGSIKMLSAQSGAVKVGDNFDEANNFIFTVGDGQAMSGIDQGVRGMKQGGVRRLVLPVKAAYSLPLDKSGGPVPSDFGPRRQIERELQREDPYNYFYFEVEATRVR